jgi:hypothetical protein
LSPARNGSPRRRCDNQGRSRSGWSRGPWTGRCNSNSRHGTREVLHLFEICGGLAVLLTCTRRNYLRSTPRHCPPCPGRRMGSRQKDSDQRDRFRADSPCPGHFPPHSSRAVGRCPSNHPPKGTVDVLYSQDYSFLRPPMRAFGRLWPSGPGNAAQSASTDAHT